MNTMLFDTTLNKNGIPAFLVRLPVSSSPLATLRHHVTGAIERGEKEAITEKPADRKFKVGRTYSCRSLCDHDCIFAFEIVKRTEKTVTLKSSADIKRRKIYMLDGVEHADPLGKYSMSPIIRADREIA